MPWALTRERRTATFQEPSGNQVYLREVLRV